MDSVDLRRPWIGIQGAPVPRQMMESRGLPSGIYVTGVFADSPALRAGLKAFPRFGSSGVGDVIMAVDHVQVESVDEMVGYLNSKTPGDAVTLTLFREGQERTVEVTLDPWPDGA
jgi:S1-C subfamily serine protease